MRTSPSPTYDAGTIVAFHVVAHSLHIVQMLASPALHSFPTHLHISCAGLDTVLLWNMFYILICSLRWSPFVNKSLSTEQLNAKYKPFDNPIHNHQRYTMLYIHSRWITTLCVAKTTLVHQLTTLHTMRAFTLYRDGVFSYLQCSWIIQEHFEPGISFTNCSNNIWQPFFALLKNCYAWTIVVFTTNSSILTKILDLLGKRPRKFYTKSYKKKII